MHNEQISQMLIDELRELRRPPAPDAAAWERACGRVFDEKLRQYLRNQTFRLQRTFELLGERLAPLPASGTLLDVGTMQPYHPLLKRTFPSWRFSFLGDCWFGPPDPEEIWFKVNAERKALPLEDESCDVCLLLEVLEHLRLDPMFLLAEINRVLRPGGIFFLTTPNLAAWSSCAQGLLGGSPLFYGRFAPAIGDSLHAHEYAPGEVWELLNAAGFSPELWTENIWYTNDSPRVMELLARFGLPQDNRKDTIVALSRKQGPVRDRYPAGIYA